LPRRPRVLVCGTTFGKVYLAGVDRASPEFELAGVLARGSERSRRLAERYGVPLYTTVEEVPDSIDLACVVVRAAIVGGRGSELAQALLRRGIHVLQEHPLHVRELAEGLRVASEHGVIHKLNTHYVHLTPVREFLRLAGDLRAAGHRPCFVDADGGVQVAHALLDIVARAIGGASPATFHAPTSAPQSPRARLQLERVRHPFRVVQAVLSGVPATIKIQNQLDPEDPDGHFHVLHRVSVGFEVGTLTLYNTHGPLLWSPRQPLPREDSAALVQLEASSTEAIGPETGARFDEIYGKLWPEAVGVALRELVREIRGESASVAQHDLAVTGAWQLMMEELGQPELIRAPRVGSLSASEVQGLSRAEVRP